MTITDNIPDTPPPSDIQEIEVETDFLVLDPNNPRFLTQHEEIVKLEDCLNPGVGEKTHAQMVSKDKHSYNFRIEELQASILTNGYRPVDRIFVRSIPNTKFYLVIEGNRRVTAIREILKNDDSPEAIKEQLKKIKVAVITSDLSEAELKTKITTILGIRHHGSLKEWSPFAQARNIYKHYKDIQGKNTPFEWDGDEKGSLGGQVADALSISTKEVKERLRVYRAMEQLQTALDFEPYAKMNQRYYSVVSAAINNKRTGLSEYLPFNDQEFKLSEKAVERFNKICYFTKPNRKGANGETAPINEPTQWRALNEILKDEDSDKREHNLKQIEDEHRKPNEVWAQRAEELNRLEWSKFFEKVGMTLAEVNMGKLGSLDSEQTKQAKALINRIKTTIEEIENNG